MTARDADGWSEWPAPAKLNLFLRVVGRRADGFHLLQTAFRLLDWGDRIRLRTTGDGRITRLGTSAPGVAAWPSSARQAPASTQRAYSARLTWYFITAKRGARRSLRSGASTGRASRQ